jgi:hypothetical protein
MYVRKKKIRRGETTYSYYQLVQGTRVEGKVRQTVVAHLGPLPHKLAARVIAKEMGLMCGEEYCGREWTVEDKAMVQRRGKQITQPIRLCEEHATELQAGGIKAVSYDPEHARFCIEAARESRARALEMQRWRERKEREWERHRAREQKQPDVFPGRAPVLPD